MLRLPFMMTIFLIVILISVGSWVHYTRPFQPLIPPDDFVEYYAAGQLNARGENPYAAPLLLPIQQQAGRDTDEAIMMWNPPWTLSLVMPFGQLTPATAHAIWLIINLTLIGGSAFWYWNTFGGNQEKAHYAIMLAVTFLPTIFVLQSGQIGPWLLLGVVGLCIGMYKKYAWLIGLSAALLAIKPHLVYLIWPSLAVWLFIERNAFAYRAASWFICVIAGATLLPLLTNHQVLTQFMDEMANRPPQQWKSPTIGSQLRDLAGAELFWLQFVPMILGLSWWLWTVRTPINQHHRVMTLILVSFTTASYGAWPFDVVILLPVIISVGAKATLLSNKSRYLFVILYLIWSLTGLILNNRGFTSEHFWWMAPGLLGIWMIFLSSTKVQS